MDWICINNNNSVPSVREYSQIGIKNSPQRAMGNILLLHSTPFHSIYGHVSIPASLIEVVPSIIFVCTSKRMMGIISFVSFFKLRILVL
jgi:hypothetical protein